MNKIRLHRRGGASRRGHPGLCSTLVRRVQAATDAVLILFILFLILFKPTEDLVQPPPTRSTNDPGQSYGPLNLRAITSRAAYPS